MPEEVEAVARALASGRHRPDVGAQRALELYDDHRDAEAVRVAAYAGLRLGEMLALRWCDVDLVAAAHSEVPILIHPLAEQAGGDFFHSGGKHFNSQSDPEWLTLKAFVLGDTAK